MDKQQLMQCLLLFSIFCPLWKYNYVTKLKMQISIYILFLCVKINRLPYLTMLCQFSCSIYTTL